MDQIPEAPPERPGLVRRHATPLAVLAIGILASLALWRVAVGTEREAVRRTVASQADAFAEHLAAGHRDREAALERMFTRWRIQERTPEPTWRSDVRLYVDHFPGIEAVGWIDADGELRRVEPEPLRSTFADALAEPASSRAIADLPRRGSIHPPGSRRVIGFHPVSAGDSPDGAIGVLVDPETAIGSILGPSIAPGYAVTVYDESRALFTRSDGADAAASSFASRRDVDTGHGVWRAEVAPLLATLDSLESPLDETVLISGLLASALVALSVALAHRARDRERALKETESLMERIAENVPVLVSVHSPDLSEIVYVNPQFEAIYGHPVETIEDDPRGFVDLVHPHDRERIARAMVEDLPDGSFEEEYRVVRPDGDVRWVKAWSAPIRDDSGEIRQLVTVTQDVTDQKRAETELKRSNEDLQQFAYVASHDLQEPLRMVTSYLGLIERRYADRLDERGHEFIHFAVDGAQRMKRLIDGLLQYSRVQTAVDQFSRVDVDDLVDEALANLQAPLRESGARIRRGDLPVVTADAAQLALVFQNLISNAIKFQDDGADPVVEIGADERHDTWVFSVSDNGVGFDPALGDQLFVLFRRLHGRDEYSGTGMGLALCRRVVERHGGCIRAESEPGVGSVFTFTLPKQPKESSP